ncbi:DNA repair protein RadC [Nitrosomonas sp. Nm34]|nr:DNA repair protein RadC [Nitrosomonas sp. Nm34]
MSELNFLSGCPVTGNHINHPSGVAEPSRADQMLTDTLKQSLSLVDVKVLDHFIIAGAQTLSMAELGLI